MSDKQTPKRMPSQAELDQSFTLLTRNFPPLWWGLYKGCVEEGFSEAQAMQLVCTYITTHRPT